jgi:hypothetical protein
LVLNCWVGIFFIPEEDFYIVSLSGVEIAPYNVKKMGVDDDGSGQLVRNSRDQLAILFVPMDKAKY